MRFRNPFAATTATRRPAARRLTVEPLDDRIVPATFSVADVTVTEGVSGTQNAAVRVTLSEPLKKSVAVSYRTEDGSAKRGSDYVEVVGPLTFAKGETAKTINVPIYGNQVGEYDESFTVRLFSPTKGVRIADGQGTVTIVDSLKQLSIDFSVGDEVDGAMTFTVRLSAPLTSAFTIDYATADYYSTPEPEWLDGAYAGQDYVATSGTLTFAPGETTQTFTVQLIADDVEEYDEYFYVLLSNPSTPVFDTSGGYGYGMIYGEYGQWW